jgi:hypothetical protein
MNVNDPSSPAKKQGSFTAMQESKDASRNESMKSSRSHYMVEEPAQGTLK